MFNYKLIDIKSLNKEKCGLVESPLYSKEWLQYLESWRQLKPTIIEISLNKNLVGYLFGVSKTVFGIKMFGSPLYGCILPYMGFNLKEDVEKDYSQILKGCIDYLKGICGFQYISICDLHNTEDRLKDLNFKFDSEKWETYILDIDKPLDEVKKGFSKTYRNYINYFAKHEGIVSEDYSEDMILNHNAQLVDVYDRDGESSPDIINKYKIMFEKLIPHGMLYCVKADIPTKKSIGSSIYLYGGEWAYLLTNATYSENLNDRPNQSMMWEAIQHFHEKGVKKMDLVGPGQYKKYYGGEYTIFYNITVSRFGIHKAMLLLRKAYIYCVKSKFISKLLGK